MCGITGLYAFNELGKFHMINLSAATEALSHRGPDFGRTDIIDRVGLGHRRLSIIDTSTDGHQPMRDSSGRYIIIFNGEIYNYAILRQRLQQRGVAFQSATDTEVLLQLYIQEGRACLDQLNGFFAFAIYDQQQDLLFAARDRLGIKPLLYYQDEDKVIFASEMKSLLAYGIEKHLDYASLQHYLRFNYVPAPHTMLQHVRKLMPGEYLEVSKSRPERGAVWHLLPDSVQRIPAEPGEAKLRATAAKTLRATGRIGAATPDSRRAAGHFSEWGH